MPNHIEQKVQKVIDSNESAYDDHVSATVDGYEFELWKDPDCDNDWYIQVNPEAESFLYDGWWDDSSDKSTEDAVREAIRGAGIFDNEIDWDSVEWRELKAGEVIQEGDFVDVAKDGWRDNPEWQPATCIGETAPDPRFPSHRTYRRILRK